MQGGITLDPLQPLNSHCLSPPVARKIYIYIYLPLKSDSTDSKASGGPAETNSGGAAGH